MTDLQLAKQTLANHGYSVCVVLGGQIIYTSKDYGIKPMYLAYKNGYDFSNCCGVDKVVGLGAAAFWASMHIGFLYTRLISEPAIDFLCEHDIKVEYDQIVPRIKNRTGDGFCPVETIASQADDFDEFLLKTEAFLRSVNLI